jgi:translin
MSRILDIAEAAHKDFEARTLARDAALTRSRALIRHSSNAIRAIHRSESDLAHEHLDAGRELVDEMKKDLENFPDLYYAGYTQDAIKEFCEATLTTAIIEGREIPTPDEMGVIYSTYLRGMAETPGELRRRCMDILRMGYSDEAERLLGMMDEIYSILVTMDYPDAVTNGLRRQTDLLRGIVERTRADLTLSLREEHLKALLRESIDTFSKEK